VHAPCPEQVDQDDHAPLLHVLVIDPQLPHDAD
jgi:hypothetical protein